MNDIFAPPNPAPGDDGLSALFAVPQIHTDEHGVHRDDAGRRYDAVDLDGELTYQLVDDLSDTAGVAL